MVGIRFLLAAICNFLLVIVRTSCFSVDTSVGSVNALRSTHVRAGPAKQMSLSRFSFAASRKMNTFGLKMELGGDERNPVSGSELAKEIEASFIVACTQSSTSYQASNLLSHGAVMRSFSA